MKKILTFIFLFFTTTVYSSSKPVIILTNELPKNISYAKSICVELEKRKVENKLIVCDVFTKEQIYFNLKRGGEICSKRRNFPSYLIREYLGHVVIFIERYSEEEYLKISDSLKIKYNFVEPERRFGPVTQREFNLKVEPSTFYSSKTSQSVGIIDSKTGETYSMETFIAPTISWVQLDSNINYTSLSVRVVNEADSTCVDMNYNLFPLYGDGKVESDADYLTELHAGIYKVQLWLDKKEKVDEVIVTIKPKK